MDIDILLFTLLLVILVGSGLFTGLVLSIKLGFLPKLDNSKNTDIWFTWLCRKAGIVKSL
jgi:hypothetical protein